MPSYSTYIRNSRTVELLIIFSTNNKERDSTSIVIYFLILLKVTLDSNCLAAVDLSGLWSLERVKGLRTEDSWFMVLIPFSG